MQPPPVKAEGGEGEGVLGAVPHQLRGFLAQFRTMVQTREFVRYGDNGKKIIYFRLYDYLTCSPPCSDLIELHNGLRYLRLDCLADD